MPKIIGTMARTALIAGTATSVSNRVARRQHGRWLGQAQQQSNEAPAPARDSPPAPLDVGDKLAHLQQLGDLRAQGILTDEEFASQKDKILAG